MFVRLIYKARRLEKRHQELLREKQDSYAESLRQEVKLTRKQKYRHFCIDLQRSIIKYFKFPKHSCPYRLSFNIKNNGTVENFVVKSIAGFLGGFCLTYIFFMFFVLQLNFTLSTATIMCSIFGSILTLGLAFSYKVRCIVFLVLPQFFSKKGRQALLAYAYILAITGPAKNTLNNMSILGESLACGQEQLKAAVKQILEVVKKPFYAIRDAIKKVVATVKEIVAKIKDILLSIKRIIMSLVKIVKSAFDFIARMLNICNQEFGTPFQRCHKVFEEAIVDCNAKLGPMFNWLCNITYLVKNVCYLAKALDFLCMIIDFIKSTVTSIVTKVKQFVRHIRTMFYVRIKFSHSYHFESNHSKSMGDITAGIVTEIKQRSSGLIKIFDFISSAASLFFIFMIVKVIYYRHKFLTNEKFDNKFITRDFRKLDLRRAHLGLETVLPLNHRERKLYISTSSMRLVKKEKSRVSEAAMILLMSTLKLSTHMATDYSLYWIMTKIRYYGRFQSKINAPNTPGVYIEGEGFLAGLLKGIVKAFQPLGFNLEIDTIPCLPDPIPPDYDRYIQIGSLLILCWFLAIFEPYGLRFRHSVMCFYHPQRARERAIWLYNHILRTRSSFLKFARRQLRRKVKSDKSIAKITCTEYIRANLLKYPICIFFFGSGKQSNCLLCGEVYREGDKKTFIKCQTPKCQGLYCEQCFSDLQNLCTVCLDPISYGDLSDISEEKDSSEDDVKMKRKVTQEKKKKKLKKKSKMNKFKESKNYDDNYDDDDTDHNTRLLPLKDQGDTDYSPVITDKTRYWESDWSSDYDFTYQQNKDISRKSEDATPRVGHSDIEKQNIPQLASMQDFHTYILYYLNNYSDCEEVYDTSSIITDLGEVSLQHLNQSPNGKQSWLKYKGNRKQKADSPAASQFSSSLTSPLKQFYTSPESDYDDDLFNNTQIAIPMRHLNSKMSLENNESTCLSMETASTRSTQESSHYSQINENTTTTSTIDSPKIQETSFMNNPKMITSINQKLCKLKPIQEESTEFIHSVPQGIKNNLNDKGESAGYTVKSKKLSETTLHHYPTDREQYVFTKNEKDLLNAVTSKEGCLKMTSSQDVYDTPSSHSVIESPTVLDSGPLNYYDFQTSPEVSPLALTYSSSKALLEDVPPIQYSETGIQTSTEPSSRVSPQVRNIIKKTEPTGHPDVPKLDLNFLDKNSNEGKDTESQLRRSEQFCKCGLTSASTRSPISYEQVKTQTLMNTRETTSQTYSSSRSTSCNCRLFKDKVKYSVLNECEHYHNSFLLQKSDRLSEDAKDNISSSTSSLISSLYKLPDSFAVACKPSARQESSFNTTLAAQDTIVSTIPDMFDRNMQTSPSIKSFSLNTSERSVRKCSLDATTTTYNDQGEVDNKHIPINFRERSSPASKDTSSKSSIDYSTHSYDIIETSTSDSIYILPRTFQKQKFVVQSSDRVYNLPSQKDLYKERIRSYYRHLNVPQPPMLPNTPRMVKTNRTTCRRFPVRNPIRNLWKVFKNKDKR